jgi:hypothetical protein
MVKGEFWKMNRNRAKAGLPPIDNEKPGRKARLLGKLDALL